MWWTVLLVSTSCTALFLSARHWWGWAFGAGTEVLWALYALSIASTTLLIMSFVWGVVHTMNAVRTRRT